MIEPTSLVVPHVAAAEASTPAPEAPLGEAHLPAPTAEQAQTADRVFGDATEPNTIGNLLGIATSILLLRDVAVDTFDTSGEEEEEKAKKKLGKDEDTDCIE